MQWERNTYTKSIIQTEKEKIGCANREELLMKKVKRIEQEKRSIPDLPLVLRNWLVWLIQVKQ